MSEIYSTDKGSIGAGSRKKFIRRYKDQIKDRLRESIDANGIKDIAGKRKVRVVTKSLDEPSYGYDPLTGRREYVGNENQDKNKGDTYQKKPQDSKDAASGAGKGEDEYGDFTFDLRKEELLDILFEDMHLPDYIKQGLKTDTLTKLIRRGHAVDGIPVNINPVKTIMASMARKIAFKGATAKAIEEAETEEEKEELRNKKAPYLEDSDLRYKRYETQEEPIRHAVMIMLMDVSGSMTAKDREMAKKFFLLLFLFLEKAYTSVDMRFITYTTTAKEVNEFEFFNGRRFGGTSLEAATILVRDVISEYDCDKNNIYLAHVSDGDVLSDETQAIARNYDEGILPYVQYVAYLELVEGTPNALASYTYVSSIYLLLKERHRNIGIATATEDCEIFPALKELFKED
jgi:uncharacterized sporulation protein YeaH/YhbH (DUF444 family)